MPVAKPKKATWKASHPTISRTRCLQKVNQRTGGRSSPGGAGRQTDGGGTECFQGLRVTLPLGMLAQTSARTVPSDPDVMEHSGRPPCPCRLADWDTRTAPSDPDGMEHPGRPPCPCRLADWDTPTVRWGRRPRLSVCL